MSTLGENISRAIRKKQEEDKKKEQPVQDPNMFEKAKQILGYSVEDEEKKKKPS